MEKENDDEGNVLKEMKVDLEKDPKNNEGCTCHIAEPCNFCIKNITDIRKNRIVSMGQY